MVREPPSSEKEKAENDWRRGASAFRLRPMSDLPQPEVIITHESDLDGFVSGHLLQRLAHTLFNKKPPLQAWNYNNWERRPLREKCAWVCDLNFAARMDRDNWLIVDHHATEVVPQKCKLIHDTTKSASLLCYELCKEHGLGNETLDRLVHLTNVGDLFLTDDPEFTTAIDYGGLVKQYFFWNLHTLIGGDLESLVDHPLLKVVVTRREVENPLGFAHAKANLEPITDTIGLVDAPVGDSNAIVHQLLADSEVPYKVLATLATRFRSVSVSLRSLNGEALPVAKQLQGGGHPNASGATLPNTVQRIPDAVVYLRKVLNPELEGEGLGSLEAALKGL
tara:strand:+ start:723 stop:1730 length:1008 start_codon:yes stop_codon:yes gene_type:complete